MQNSLGKAHPLRDLITLLRTSEQTERESILGMVGGMLMSQSYQS